MVLESVLPLQRLSTWSQVLHGSIHSFPLVRHSCPLSAGVLHTLCVWHCIPDVSVERDVLHVHLLLRHLALWKGHFYLCGSEHPKMRSRRWTPASSDLTGGWSLVVNVKFRDFSGDPVVRNPPACISPCSKVHSLCLLLHCCPINLFFSTILLDSIYIC